jgi:2-hydroxychromene-2-carboxylate isomerase
MTASAPSFGDPKKLYFFFDFISHNAYLAWVKIEPLAKKHGLELEPVPVLFAGFLERFGQKGPAEMPSKARWMLWNILRKTRIHGIPIAPPHSHPFNPLLPLRACCAVQGRERVALVDRLFRATWAESKAVSTEEVVRAEIAACGLDADRLLADAASDAVKAQLRANLEAALSAGAFGVPTMLVRKELFWGFDDLEFLDTSLSGEDALGADKAAFAPWFAIRPSAMRKAVSKKPE